MSRLPPIRPRQQIGRVVGSAVYMDEQFMRWLELLPRRAEETTASIAAFSVDLPVTVSVAPSTDFAPVVAVSAPSEDFDPV